MLFFLFPRGALLENQSIEISGSTLHHVVLKSPLRIKEEPDLIAVLS